jgi:hypothetical protein
MWWSVAALILVAVGGVLWEARADAEKQPAVKPSPLLEPAKQAYKGVAAAFDVGTASLADLYHWSRRWMDAEVASAQMPMQKQQAKDAHLERMKNLHGKIAALNQHGIVGGEPEKFYATKYFLEEAKLLAKQ